MIHLDPIPICI